MKTSCNLYSYKKTKLNYSIVKLAENYYGIRFTGFRDSVQTVQLNENILSIHLSRPNFRLTLISGQTAELLNLYLRT